jgi:Xaa-Pro aminopeptidase
VTDRLQRAADSAQDLGLDALLVTPGPELRYLTGYDAKALDRLTCLVLSARFEPVLIVPLLEESAAQTSGFEGRILTWTETDDPFAIVAELLADTTTIGVDREMWAERVFALQRRLPHRQWRLSSEVTSPMRVRKDAAELKALSEAAQAIDRVHVRMGEWLRPGRTERQVGADIAAAIREEGHETVDFVIVGSGPNGASPHHEVSDRVIEAGDPVVVDIGGTTAAGYCSDSTRNYVVGAEPDAEYLALFEVLRAAQRAQRNYARAGVSAESIDAVGRQIIADAGYGDYFIHRTGHGIGQQTHEDPYIVAGNRQPIEPGMAFSIEPGIYLPGRFGARIEDIVVCTETGIDVLNRSPRDLVRL